PNPNFSKYLYVNLTKRRIQRKASTNETVYFTSKRSTPTQHFMVDKNRRAKTQTFKEIKGYVSKL
ncbi:16339_t:CDS:2, partial [Gigaspora margarita]